MNEEWVTIGCLSVDFYERGETVRETAECGQTVGGEFGVGFAESAAESVGREG